MMFPFTLFYSVSAQNSLFTLLPILDQGKIYPPTNREAIWTALGWAHCPLEHWLNFSSVDGSGFVGITPSPL